MNSGLFSLTDRNQSTSVLLVSVLCDLSNFLPLRQCVHSLNGNRRDANIGRLRLFDEDCSMSPRTGRSGRSVETKRGYSLRGRTKSSLSVP